ncbi:hypothetical protein K439DRAFT_1633330 [Ramaria rubella]|nr:hypothetical protein K439DRAFT_1633330 [Ramaria rubella]
MQDVMLFCSHRTTGQDPDRHGASAVYTLADALHTRFKQSGGIEDLDAVIMHHRNALALWPSGHSDPGGWQGRAEHYAGSNTASGRKSRLLMRGSLQEGGGLQISAYSLVCSVVVDVISLECLDAH